MAKRFRTNLQIISGFRSGRAPREAPAHAVCAAGAFPLPPSSWSVRSSWMCPGRAFREDEWTKTDNE